MILKKLKQVVRDALRPARLQVVGLQETRNIYQHKDVDGAIVSTTQGPSTYAVTLRNNSGESLELSVSKDQFDFFVGSTK